jgi:hypothetical protein
MSTTTSLLQSFGPHNTHHLEQTRAWLALSESGAHTTALSYAALELRFAIERLALEYWRAILDRPLTVEDLHTASSFKRIERAIYDLAGHQREINLHFDFMSMLIKELKIEVPVTPPQMGRLSNYWHESSEFCHISWPISSRIPELPEKVFAKITEMVNEVALLNSSVRWFTLREETIDRLRREYVEGKATLENAREHLRSIGVWAMVKYPDDRPSHFIGEPIPPIAALSVSSEPQ